MTDYHRKNPYLAKIKARKLLTPAPSTRRTYHVELDIQDSHLQFQVGDSIGIFPKNPDCVVFQILERLRVSKEDLFLDKRSEEKISYFDFLSKKANLTKIPSSILTLLHQGQTSLEKKQYLEHLLHPDQKALKKPYLEEHELWDLLEEHSEALLDPQEICSALLPMMPRFYSIASSPKVYPNEIHLTVAYVEYTSNNCKRIGIASHFLTKAAEIEKTPVPIYIHPARNFTLPMDASIPIIMIGPGTGIAPYRGFMQERALAHGKNWLFFGERHQATDYYYQNFWKDLISQKKLKLDLAFSRDQKTKTYVQHKMLENAKDLWKWIQEGAQIFVCGDAEKMAKDVDLALHQIAQTEGQCSEEEAKLFIKNLKLEKRYLLDVY